MDSIAQRIARLSPEKRAILDHALKQRDLPMAMHKSIPRRSSREPAPLSFAQQRLWFLSKLDPDSRAYHQPSAIRLTGDLDLAALKLAFDALLARHEILRSTVYAADESMPLQIVKDLHPFDLQVIDLSGLSNADKPTELHNRIIEITDRLFDLTRDTVLRAALLRLDASDHILLLVSHHIATDAWSNGILWRELATLYEAFLKRAANPLPELPIQYGDFAAWQRGRLQGSALEHHITYWKKHLDGIAPLRLAPDSTTPATVGYPGASRSWLLARPLISRLRELSRGAGATLFMTMLAAFQALLYRYTGQDDIATGSPIAGRTRSETEGLIGPFVNTLVLRSDLSGNPSFQQLLDRVKRTALAAYEHQEMPFEKLVVELHPNRDFGRNPLVQVMFAHQNQPPQPVEFSGLSVTPVEIQRRTAKFDLSLDTWEEPDGLKATLEYRTDLFDSMTAMRLLSHYENLLRAVVDDPNRSIGELPILSVSERRQLLVEGNGETSDLSTDKPVHQLIEEQAAATPDDIAVVCAEDQLTYEELNRRANQLAHRLRKLGVGDDDVVGICLESHVNLMVALLATLKAGGAYLPLDPDHPRSRLQFMLQDTGATVLLTQKQLMDIFPKFTGKTIALESEWGELALERSENPLHPVAPNNLAYVIFTSGSTGKPKGVLIEHRGLTNYLNYCTSVYPIREGRGSLVHSSIAFDATITGLFAPLLVGRAVYLLPKHDSLESLAKQLRELRDFSLVKITPAHLKLLSQQIPEQEANGLTRCFVIGGENLVAEQIRFWQQNAPDTRLFNEYGPTENVVGCIAFDASQWRGGGSVPIGRPIRNTTAYVLDRNMQLVPAGAVGELYLGGVGVARGYLNQDSLTREKFVTDRFSAEPKGRLYRTGDLVRYLPGGMLEFLGRMDDQVKLRGYRIELGEIEAVLCQHPAIQGAAVAAQGEDRDDRQLVGYYVSDADPLPTSSELREFLKVRLPDFMVPAILLPIDALPLTSNGKVDRRALSLPDTVTMYRDNSPIAPRDELEFRLMNIWQSVLGSQRIGIKDNFFDLGGHSLLAMTVIDQIEKTCGKRIPLGALFQAPTIEGLTAFVRKKNPSETSTVLPIQPTGSKLPFFCVQGSSRLSHYLGPDQPFFALHPLAIDGIKVSSRNVEEIASECVKQIREIQPEGPYLLGGFSFGGKVAFEIAHQIRNQGQEVRLLALLDPGNMHEGFPASGGHFSLVTRELQTYTAALHRGLSKLGELRFGQKLNFLWRAVQWRLAEAVQRVERALKKLECWFYIASGLHVPKHLWSFYFVENCRRALSKYAPQVYPGRLVVFPTEELAHDARMQWGQLAGGGLELHVVPGNHSNVMSDSMVRFWAEKLKVYLDDAQRQTAVDTQNSLSSLS
jgi:amino acid adenylation domain-containing protein